MERKCRIIIFSNDVKHVRALTLGSIISDSHSHFPREFPFVWMKVEGDARREKCDSLLSRAVNQSTPASVNARNDSSSSKVVKTFVHGFRLQKCSSEVSVIVY